MGNALRNIRLNESTHYLDLFSYLLKNANRVIAPMPLYEWNEEAENKELVGWYTRYEFDKFNVYESYFKEGRLQLTLTGGKDDELMEETLQCLERILFGMNENPKI